jgi:cysteine desulfurase / selenocysteine lyase
MTHASVMTADTYDVPPSARLPDPRARGARPAARLPRQRRLGPEAAGGDRRRDAAYAREYANVHRGLHYLSSVATERYEAVRETIRRFLGARHEEEIVFTTGSTMGINLVASAWAAPRFEPGDEIVLSVMEHHANIVPWHFLRERQGAVLRWVEPEPDGSLPPEKVIEAIGPRTKLVAITHMSNVLGTVVDVKAIAAAARARGVATLVDGSQAAVHMPVDVADLGVDFYVVTGHKLYGPTGSGALYVRRDRYPEMRPFLGGGDMIREVTRDAVTYADPPLKFEAGTPGIVQMIGLGAALDYMSGLGLERIAAHEAGLRDYALSRLRRPQLADPPGHRAGQGRDLLLHAPGRGAPARHLDRRRPQGRGGARRPPLRPAADGPSRRHRDLPRLLRPLQHARGGRRPGRRARALPRPLQPTRRAAMLAA